MSTGVSVLICTKNGAGRLPETLAHLAAQQVPKDLPWEILLVDNGSTDGTLEVAVQLWPNPAPAPLIVLSEPRSGKTNALELGWRKSRYPVVIIVDDDNWLEPDYVSVTASIFAAWPEVAVTNGYSAGAFEEQPPKWFQRFLPIYAISIESWPSGDVTGTLPIPFGAGMGIRKAAVDALYRDGFQYLLRGRTKDQMGGEDMELCTALKLGGWHWWRDKRLKLRHFMPSGRLRWAHCRRLGRGGGAAYARLDLYGLGMEPPPAGPLAGIKETWPWLFMRSLKPLVVKPLLLARCLFTEGEGNEEIFWMETRIGRVIGVLRFRSEIHASIKALRAAVWIRTRTVSTGRGQRFREVA
jgi:glycosyltransferase involved in cell wall biosynthesis